MKFPCTGPGCANQIDYAKRDVQAGKVPDNRLCPECAKKAKRGEQRPEARPEAKKPWR